MNTKHRQRVMKILGAKEGDIVTPSGDIGYAKGGGKYLIHYVDRYGVVDVELIERPGSHTTWSRSELMAAKRRGVTFTVA